MRISQVIIPESEIKNEGLKAIAMKRLGKVVLLAGKNGSGKTRFFRILERFITNYPIQEHLINGRNRTKELEGALSSHMQHVTQLEERIKGTSAEAGEHLQRELEIGKGSVQSIRQELEQLKTQLLPASYLKIEPQKTDNGYVYFVPKTLQLADSYSMSREQIEQNAKKVESHNTNELAQGVLAAIQDIQTKHSNINTIDSSDLDITSEEKEKINRDYQRLKEYIFQFMGTELKRDSGGNPILFGRRIGQAQLSDGQIILLQFCLALYAREQRLDNLIIFMDEPENHLHPEALLYVLDKIAASIPNGQLWIATHSVNVLAHFDASTIHYIENGEISYSGNIPQRVLNGLIGENETERLLQFISLPITYAMYKFAYESLAAPEVVFNGSEDHQNQQMKQQISKLSFTGEKRKVLDIGIGKGRFLASVDDSDRQLGQATSNWLDYYGFDLADDFKDFWKPVFETVYGDAEDRFFTSMETLSNLHSGSFNVLLLCNVLHEIPPADWKDLFNGTNSAYTLLNDNGYVLILEDQFMPVGEKANQFGFLLLGSAQIKILFGISAHEKDYSENDYRGDGRIKAYRIPKRCLQNISLKTIRSAIESLHSSSLHEIETIREKEVNYPNGRLHALWVQQFANSALALEKLKEQPEQKPVSLQA